MLVPERQSIFRDPAGKRWKVIQSIGITVALITSVLGVMLYFTILLLPVSPMANAYRNQLQSFPLHAESKEEAARKYFNARLALRHRAGNMKRIKSRLANEGQVNHTVIGFYVNWDPNSFTSFRQHVDALTYVMPEWLSLSTTDPHGYTNCYSTAPNSLDAQVVEIARTHKLPLIPMLNNANDTDFQWAPL